MANMKPFLHGFFLFATLTRAQLLPSQYNLTSILSSQAQLSVFTEYVKQHPSILSHADSGNITILAPSNTAFTTYFNSTEPANQTAFSALLSYHILKGRITQNQLTKSPQFIPTLLSDSTYANITGGQQIEAVSPDGGIVFYSGLKTPSKVITANIVYAGKTTGVIHIIDTVLTIPIDVATTAREVPALSGFLPLLIEPPPDPALVGIAGPEKDWTLFAPNSSTFDPAAFSQDIVFAYEEYHFIKGRVIYSPRLTDGAKLKSLQGSDLTITVLNGSIFVNDAKIISPDIMISTGVVHLIDHALNLSNTAARPDNSSSTTIRSPSPFVTPSGQAALTTGAKVGIGIGASFMFLVLLGSSIFFLRRFRNSSHRCATEIPNDPNQSPAEMMHAPIKIGLPYNSMPTELLDHSMAIELPHNSMPVELSADLMPTWGWQSVLLSDNASVD